MSNPVTAKIELFYSGIWNDITSYVYNRDQIQITRGKQPEASTVDPSSCTLTLNNRSGRFSPRNPLSPLYGLIGRNTPLRVSGTVASHTATRFVGEVSSWPQAWDTSGKDVYTKITAAGILRRLGQGQPVKQTGLKTFVTAGNFMKCWPCDTKYDISGLRRVLTLNHCAANVQFGLGEMGTGLPAGMLIDTTNLVTGNVYPASGFISGIIGLTSGGTFDAAGFVFKSSGLGSGAFYLQSYGTLSPGGYVALFDAVATTVTLYRINYDPDVGYNLTLIDASAAQGFYTDGAVHSFLWTIVDAGGSLTHTAYIDGVSIATGSDSTASLQGIAQFQLTYDPTTVSNGSAIAVSYITAWTDVYNGSNVSPNPVTWAQVADGYIGETAGRRIERLCTENSIPFTSQGDLDATMAMGAQGQTGLVALITEAANTDLGTLTEPVDSLGLHYRTRADLYNQASALTLDYSAKVFSAAPSPTDDDQSTHNDVTVTNSGGGSAEAILTSGPLSVQAPPDGINTYPTSYSVNAGTDGPLDDLASWLLHLGTIDEARYPTVPLNLLTPAILTNGTLVAAILGLDVTEKLVIENLPAWLPPDDVSLLTFGYTEQLTQTEWSMSFNCGPESPYEVAVYGATQGAAGAARYDAENSWLDAGINSSATSLAIVSGIATTMWTTDPAACPFDINIGGERMTVSAVTGSDMSFVGVGTSATGNNASVTPGLPAGVAIGDLVLIFASIRNSGTGTVNIPAGWTNLVNDMGNCRIVGRVYDGVWTMPTVTFAGGVANADTIAQSCAFRGIRLTMLGNSSLNGSAQNISKPGGNIQAFGDDVIVMYAAWKQDDFSAAVITSGALGASLVEIGEAFSTAGDDAAQVWNYGLRAIDPGTVDPSVVVTLQSVSWTITGGAAAISRSTQQVLRRAPQTFTVTRSVNGVVKSHSAGESVRLWNTPRYAL